VWNFTAPNPEAAPNHAGRMGGTGSGRFSGLTAQAAKALAPEMNYEGQPGPPLCASLTLEKFPFYIVQLR
jgi:hypothetical protein